MAGQCYQYVGGPRDGDDVVSQVEGPLRIRVEDEMGVSGVYILGVLVEHGNAVTVLIWEPDSDIESYGL